MSDRSSILSMPYIQPSQAQKHVTHNEALRQLDAIVQLAVISAELATPPLQPDEGARYIVAPGGTDAWADQDHSVAVWTDAAWIFHTPNAGWRADVLATGDSVRFDGTAWGAPATAELQNAPLAGINTTADTTNRLSVSSDATLLNHDGTGHQLKLNKATAGDTASLLFQTGFGGRAEMGTAGNDDFSIKVSDDGNSFVTALTVDGASGLVTMPNTPNTARERLTAHRDYFVRIDGNNNNTGLANTGAQAFRTIQHAVDAAMSLDCGVYNVTISVAAGAYNEAIKIDGRPLGSGNFVLEGNTADPSLVSLSRATCENGAVVTIRGFEFTANTGLQVLSASQVTLGNARFSGGGTALQMRQGSVNCDYSDISFASSITTIATMYNYAYLSAFGATFDIPTGANWGASGAFFASGFCLVWLQGAQFTGDVAGAVGRRYSASIMSAINTNGQNADFIPGTSAGTTSSGSFYV